MNAIHASGGPSVSRSFQARWRWRAALRRRTAPPSAASVTDATVLLGTADLGPGLRPLRVVDALVPPIVAAGDLRRLPEEQVVEELRVAAERVLDRIDEIPAALAERVGDDLAGIDVGAGRAVIDP